MEWNKIVIDNLAHLVILGLSGFLIYICKKIFLEPTQQVQRELIKHVDECNKIPKALLLSKIETLCEKQDEQNEATKEFRAELKERIDVMSERYHNNIVPALGTLATEVAGLKAKARR